MKLSSCNPGDIVSWHVRTLEVTGHLGDGVLVREVHPGSFKVLRWSTKDQPEVWPGDTEVALVRRGTERWHKTQTGESYDPVGGKAA